jgi:hypothetical protein
MNAIEELIRKKLSGALTEQRRQVATSLFEIMQPMKPLTQHKNGAALKNTSAHKQERQEAKRQQIQTLTLKISQLSTSVSQSKDPEKMRAQLDIQKAKLDVAKQELAAIE